METGETERPAPGRRARRLEALLLVGLTLGACDWAGEDEIDSNPADELARHAEKLEALGYVNRVPARERITESGVTRHEMGMAFDGLNLFNLRDDTRASLMAMNGRVVHRWASAEEGSAFTHMKERLPAAVPVWMRGWNHVEPTPQGDLLVIGSHHMLLRLSWNSRTIWRMDVSAHHDLAVDEDGGIFALVNGLRTAELEGRDIVFQDDAVLAVSPEGQPGRRLSVYDAMRDEPAWTGVLDASLAIAEEKGAALVEQLLDEAGRARAAADPERAELLERTVEVLRGEREPDGDPTANIAIHATDADIFHANSVQVLPTANPGVWRRGDLLLCLRNLDLLVVIDSDSGALRWSWGRGELDAPHHATLLDDGTILVFGNGAERGHSRVMRVDPRSEEIVWSYQGEPPPSFFSATRGGCQTLPNGNVLITETNRGRAFEITPEGEIVWEYLTEATRSGGSGDLERSAIYRMTRLPHEFAASMRARR